MHGRAHAIRPIPGREQLVRHEPAGWAEELLPVATTADVAQLPRLCIAASTCLYMGRPEDAVGYAQAASALQDDPGYQPFDSAWASFLEAIAHFYAGRVDRYVEICTALAARTGLGRIMGLSGLATGLTFAGRSGEAMAIADDGLIAARVHANPLWIASAYYALLAVFFDRISRPEIAATLYGTTTHHAAVALGFTVAIDPVRNALGTDTFDRCVATGAAMDTAEAVRYAHHHINNTREHQP